jgi:uncharacterized iron-regulated protein
MIIASVGISSSNQKISDNATDPGTYLVEKASQNKLILIGTHHKNPNIHNVIIDSLPELVNTSGIDTLFVEISYRQQHVINSFLRGEADVEKIMISNIIASDSYHQILTKARDLKMKIIAIDNNDPSSLTRDEWMAINIATYLHGNPRSRGMVIVGERHILKNIEWLCMKEPSLADFLKMYIPFSVMTWPEAIDHYLPVAMDVTPNKFKGIKDPTLMALNTKSEVSIETAADGIILLPRTK